MTEMKYTPRQEIDRRISGLQARLREAKMDGALIIHHTNLFYFTGTSQNGYLYIPKAGRPLLMVKKSLSRARMESPLEDIVGLGSLKKIRQVLADSGIEVGGSIAMELDVIPYNTWKLYSRVFEGVDLLDVSGLVRQVRIIKSEHEISCLENAAGVLDLVFSRVPGWLREGMTEVELAALFEAGMRKRGFGGCSKMRAFNQDFFLGNIATGVSAAVPSYFDGPVGGSGLTPANNPHGAGWKKIRRNESVYIDYTCVVGGYTADAARVFVMGELPDHLMKAHETALDIQEELAGIALPGVSWEAVYERSLSMAAEAGLEKHFMGIGENQVRFVGHGVGLELDELPVFAKGLDKPLEKGMTFALEPKFVFPEGAVGIENTFVVTENGAKPLTRAPQEIVRVGD